MDLTIILDTIYKILSTSSLVVLAVLKALRVEKNA